MPVALCEAIAREEVREAQRHDLARLEERGTPAVAIAGPHDVEPGAHQVEGGAVGSDVEHFTQRSVSGASRREVDLGLYRAEDLTSAVDGSVSNVSTSARVASSR